MSSLSDSCKTSPKIGTDADYLAIPKYFILAIINIDHAKGPKESYRQAGLFKIIDF